VLWDPNCTKKFGVICSGKERPDQNENTWELEKGGGEIRIVEQKRAPGGRKDPD